MYLEMVLTQEQLAENPLELWENLEPDHDWSVITLAYLYMGQNLKHTIHGATWKINAKTALHFMNTTREILKGS